MIRKYTSGDREKIKHLYRDELFPELTLSFYFDDHYKPFVYEEEGKILGVIMLHQDYLMLDIINLYVDSEHRDKGIGQALLSFAEEYARKKKLHGVKLETGKDDEKTRHFFSKCGYQRVGEVLNSRVKDEASIFRWKGTTTDSEEEAYARKEKLNRMNERRSRKRIIMLNSYQIQYINVQLRRKIEYFKKEAKDEKNRETMENNIEFVQGIIQSLEKAMNTN